MTWWMFWFLLSLCAVLWGMLGGILISNIRLVKENRYLLNMLYENEIPILINWREEARKR